MKRITAVIALLTLTLTPSYAARRAFAELPEAVQKAIVDQKLGNEKGMTIDEDMENGKTVYQVTMKRAGQNTKLWIAEDGTILKDNQGGVAVTASTPVTASKSVLPGLNKTEKMLLGDTPVAVQNTVKAQGFTAENVEVDKEDKNNRIEYQVRFKQEGRDTKLWIAEDGRILKDSRKDSLTSRLGFEKIEFNQLPAAAKKTIRDQAGGAEISKIEKESEDGQTVYKVEFKKEGKNGEIRVAEDGTLIEKDRALRGLELEQKAGAEKPAGTEAIRAKDDKSNVSLTDLPKEVRDAIIAQKGDSNLQGIKVDKESKEGKTFYQVKFKKEGKDTKLRIAEDGTVLPERD